MGRGKRAISTLVTTVLIILIVVIAITIVWMMIIPIMQSFLVNSDITARASIITAEGYTYWDANNQVVCVQVENKEGELEGINIIVFAGKESYTKTMRPAPQKNAAKSYCFISGIGKPDKISVAPIVKVGSSEKTLSITSSIDKILSGVYPSDSSTLDTVGIECESINDCPEQTGRIVECTNSQCDYTTITECIAGDSFCPTGCDHSTDGDCSVCSESWTCGAWSTCATSQQSRTCTDSNKCGTIVNRPALSQSCTPACVPTAEICDGIDNNCNGQIDETCECTTYQCLIQRTVLYLPFDDNLNNLGTSSVTAEMRNLSGVDSGTYKYVTGLNGKAIDFNRTIDSGNGDYVTTVGANSCLFRNLSCGTKTISFWMRTIGQPQFSNRAVITGTMYVDHSASTGGWNIGMNRIDGVSVGSDLTLEVSSSPSNKKLSFYMPNSPNWVNIVLILNNTDIRFYKNSILNQSLSNYGGFNPTIRYARDDLTIGAGYPVSYLYGYNGSIDEFMVFNYSLSQAEINLLYNSQK